jgi:hypothetical protein
MKGAMKEATHAFCQQGESIRKQKAMHPLFVRNLDLVFSPGNQKVRSDVKGTVTRGTKQPVGDRNKQKKSPCRRHKSLAFKVSGRCSYKFCPGITNAKSDCKRPRRYGTYMRCADCSSPGKNIFYCNGFKKGVSDIVLCHVLHHKAHHSKEYDGVDN